MNSQPELSVIIVNYNTPQYTAQCLKSIEDASPCCSYEIVIVDNASTDNSADWLAEHYPDVTLIRSEKNLGIAGGNNTGIRHSTGRYVLLLNNDTLVSPGSFDRVVSFLKQHPDVGGVGGQLLNDDGSFQSGFTAFPSLFEEFLIVTKLGEFVRPYYPSYPPSQQECEVDWISTAYMCFQRKALESVNYVDEEFFIYCDETDLQYRLKQKGWKLYYLPDVKTIHFGGKSLNPWRRRKMVYRGYILFYMKHYSAWRTLMLRLLFLTVSLAKLPFWAIAYLMPARRERSQQELRSNWEIMCMCLRSGVPAVP